MWHLFLEDRGSRFLQNDGTDRHIPADHELDLLGLTDSYNLMLCCSWQLEGLWWLHLQDQATNKELSQQRITCQKTCIFQQNFCENLKFHNSEDAEQILQIMQQMNKTHQHVHDYTPVMVLKQYRYPCLVTRHFSNSMDHPGHSCTIKTETYWGDGQASLDSHWLDSSHTQ